MRPLLLTLTAGTLALLLSGCPDLPGGPRPARSDTHSQSSRSLHLPHQIASHASTDASARQGEGRQSVGEIAWFQGTIDEAFSRHGCSEGRRTLFHF
ncbi:MAG: hypothetical protein JO158_06170 [Gammaproteobacteria bacterium]|nr:hypothetical protein [Gammaproteobacteria bacterium]